jgi:hypothetical protein
MFWRALNGDVLVKHIPVIVLRGRGFSYEIRGIVREQFISPDHALQSLLTGAKA